MKKIVRNIMALMMAALVLYGGAGVNVVSYCCNDCRNAGIEALLTGKGCAIHNHQLNDEPDNNQHNTRANNNQHNAKANNNQHNAEPNNNPQKAGDCCHSTAAVADNDLNCRLPEKCCKVELLTFDWNSQTTAKTAINIVPDVFCLLPYKVVNLADLTLLFTSEVKASLLNPPPPVCPRDYLLTLAVLLI